MMLKLLGIAVLVCIACIFLAWYFSHRARHKERMMMIERGMAPDEQQPSFGFRWLKIGIVVLGLGVGMLIISLLVHLFGDLNAFPFAIMMICGGVSMIIAANIHRGNTKP